jgi:GNAT superfamily N-acetyltransferase
MTVEVLDATTAEHRDHVAALIRDFVAWHRRVNAHDIVLIDRYFDPAAFEAELADLAQKYGPPRGALLLALADGAPAGCVAMHDLGGGSAEMKRMFVRDTYRGRGIGQLLANGIVERARAAGYRRMRLDTSRNQTDAIRLYERVGFRRIEPYYELPDEFRSWIVFYEKAL